MAEIWKVIEGFEDYQISSWGRVMGKHKIMKQHPNEKGYLMVGLRKNNREYKKRVHRLVAQNFIPNPDNLPQVNHKDGNPRNNSITNLEWTTNTDNNEHAKQQRRGIYKLD